MRTRQTPHASWRWSVHPYIMGAPHRLKYFRRIFEAIRKKEDVLFWTGAQIADWFLRAGPQAP